MKKIISLSILFAMLVNLIFPLTANAASTNFGKTDGYSSISDFIDYYYEDDAIRKVAMFYPATGKLDYCEYSIGSDKYYRAETTVDEKFDKKTLAEYLESRTNITNYLEEYYVDDVFCSPNIQLNRDDRSVILSSLYNAGYPEEYQGHNSRVYVVSSTSVMLKDNLAYNISSLSEYAFLAGTAASVIALILGFSPSSIIGIAAFVYSAVDAVYNLAYDAGFRKYNVTQSYTKNAYINGTRYYYSWKNNGFDAVVSIGAALSAGSSTMDSDYNNERRICEIAYSYYSAGVIY